MAGYPPPAGCATRCSSRPPLHAARALCSWCCPHTASTAVRGGASGGSAALQAGWLGAHTNDRCLRPAWVDICAPACLRPPLRRLCPAPADTHKRMPARAPCPQVGRSTSCTRAASAAAHTRPAPHACRLAAPRPPPPPPPRLPGRAGSPTHRLITALTPACPCCWRRRLPAPSSRLPHAARLWRPPAARI